MKVAIINGGLAYHSMFRKMGFTVVYDEMDADLICFTGGEDVSPSLYGEERHPYTHHSTARDEHEATIFKAHVGMTPMVGICRGGQFLNVMMGGSLYQDVDNHGIHGTHKAIDTPTGEVVQVTSTHHQMMIPGPMARTICVANETTYRERVLNGKVEREDPTMSDLPDVEVITYMNAPVLCFQPHPEFHGADSTREYFFNLLAREFKMEAK